jgi:hypothetical protein
MGTMPEYNQLTEDELLATLAIELYGQDISEFGPSDARRRIEDAREFLNGWLSRNREQFCGELDRRGVLAPKAMEGIVDSAIITDAVFTVGLGQPSAAIVGAILLKWGIQGLCG